MKLIHVSSLIERLPAIDSSREVGEAFARTIAPHGFMAASCGESRETPTGRTWEFFFNTWPAEWLLHYQKHDYVRHDLVPSIARLTPHPFSWREIAGGKERTAKQREHSDWVRSLGVIDGFAVPIHYPGGDFGLCVTLAGRAIEDAEERAALHIASLCAHRRCRELGGMTEASAVKAPLTRREVECLKWVLDGKSDTDIGKILNISHTTAHFHVERAKKKLGVKTRTQAAALVVTLGYL